MAKAHLTPQFQKTLADLLGWFTASKKQGMVIGGVAFALLGEPRATLDIDALVTLDLLELEEFVAMSRRFHFILRRDDAVKFAERRRVLLLKHKPTNVDVDVSLGALPFEEESLRRARKVRIGKLSIPIPTPEDLIIMKGVAHRPQDLADIEKLLLFQPKLDLRRIRKWVGEFARVLEMPEILSDVEQLIKQTRR